VHKTTGHFSLVTIVRLYNKKRTDDAYVKVQCTKQYINSDGSATAGTHGSMCRCTQLPLLLKALLPLSQLSCITLEYIGYGLTTTAAQVHGWQDCRR
jgi:hypothetical protein